MDTASIILDCIIIAMAIGAILFPNKVKTLGLALSVLTLAIILLLKDIG